MRIHNLADAVETLATTTERLAKRYEKRRDAEQTYPVAGYESEIETVTDMIGEMGKLQRKFNKLPWIDALLEQRQYDNHNKVPGRGRTYEVTRDHKDQLSAFDRDPERLYGFELIEVPYEQYVENHFKDGKRIEFVDDRNFHLRIQ